MSEHVDDIIWDWFHGALEASEERAFDEHVDSCPRCQKLVDEEVEWIARVAAAVQPATPPSRDTVLDAATPLIRFERFAADVARLADVAVEKAKSWLSKIDDPDVWTDTALGALQLFHIDGGPAVEDAVVGFVQLQPGTSFPQHTHVGSEHVFVIQGTMLDENGVEHGPGDLCEREPGTEHEISAIGEVPLIYLSIVHEGVEIFGMVFGPDSPEL